MVICVGLPIFAAILHQLLFSTKEVAIDATFGTNNVGMDLFALLAEFDGTGIPLAYCFLVTISVEHTRHSEPGILDQFLRALKAGGLNPAFFGVDKDLSEIAAVKQVSQVQKFNFAFGMQNVQFGKKCEMLRKPRHKRSIFPPKLRHSSHPSKCAGDQYRLVDHKATIFLDDVSVRRVVKDLTKWAE